METGWAEHGSEGTEIQGKVSESRPDSQYPSQWQWLGSRSPGESRAGSRRSSLVFRGPAGSEVSEGARGP